MILIQFQDITVFFVASRYRILISEFIRLRKFWSRCYLLMRVYWSSYFRGFFLHTLNTHLHIHISFIHKLRISESFNIDFIIFINLLLACLIIHLKFIALLVISLYTAVYITLIRILKIKFYFIKLLINLLNLLIKSLVYVLRKIIKAVS